MSPRLGLGIAGVVLALDQIVKAWLVPLLTGKAIAVTPFFNLVMVWNRGISFGMFQGGGDWQRWILVAFGLIVAVALAYWLTRPNPLWLAAAVGGIIGGALGNVVDRARFGAVADFFDFHVAGYHWPAFNVADAAIVCGVIGLLIDGLRGGGPRGDGLRGGGPRGDGLLGGEKKR
jgi:signal peptidase II